MRELPFDPHHPNALAIYCSDGRFTRAVEVLTEEALEHARLDTLTIPGGAGCLSSSSGGYGESEMLRKAASFLITGHHIETLVLIAHAGCGWYREKMGFYGEEVLERRQQDDLRDTARLLLGRHPTLKAHLYFARPKDGFVTFEHIPMIPPV